MKKKSLSKRFTSPIMPMKFDQTEMLLLVFVVISLLVFVSWQQGFLAHGISSMVLGASTAK